MNYVYIYLFKLLKKSVQKELAKLQLLYKQCIPLNLVLHIIYKFKSCFFN